MTRVREAAGAALSVVVLAAGCGGSDDKTSDSSKQAAGGPTPSELVGTYVTKLQRSDLPANPPDELAPGPDVYDWKLKIANTGGQNNGPVLSIINAKHGQLEGPALAVRGQQLLLRNEECAASDKPFVESAYRWTLDGRTLRLALRTGCPDKVALTVLTSRPWTKSPAG